MLLGNALGAQFILEELEKHRFAATADSRDDFDDIFVAPFAEPTGEYWTRNPFSMHTRNSTSVEMFSGMIAKNDFGVNGFQYAERKIARWGHRACLAYAECVGSVPERVRTGDAIPPEWLCAAYLGFYDLDLVQAVEKVVKERSEGG